MAEVFGVVSAGLGVGAAAGQLIDGIVKLRSFCLQVRDIPEDIQVAVDQLSTMIDVLQFVGDAMMYESRSPHSVNLSVRVLSNFKESSQQVGEVLEEMRLKLGTKKYWGRIKAVGMTKKLEKAARRSERAERMIQTFLAAQNRHGVYYLLLLSLADAR